LCGWPKFLVPLGSPSASDQYYTSEPGEKIPFSPGEEPRFITPGSIASDAYREIEQLIADMEAVSGQHETTRTSDPPGDVRSGLAIQQLLELDESRMAGTFANWEQGIEQFAKYLLEIAKTRYSDKRVLSIVGKNNQVEFVDFKSADLMGNYDVRVQAGSSLPQSKTARQQFLLQLFQQGLITDPEIVLDLLDVGQMERYWDEKRLDENRAQMENKLLQGGQYVAPQDYEDHKRHIDIHNLYRKGEEFLALPPTAQRIFAAHINVHGLLKLRLDNSMVAAPEEEASAPAPVPPTPPPEEVK
jgi:hypothetical protein